MNRDSVGIVDVECMTAAGADLDSTWSCLSRNGSGIRPLSRYVPESQSLQGVPGIGFAGEIPLGFDELAGGAAKLKRWCEPGHHAVGALAQRVTRRVGWDIGRMNPQRVALLGATALTSQVSRDQLARTGKADTKYILNQCHNIPLSAAAAELGIQGPCLSLGSACASSAHALYFGWQLITAGMVDVVLCIGHEFPIVPGTVGGLDWVSALYRRDEPEDRGFTDAAQASRPFSADRRGFVLAEGAGAVLLARVAEAERLHWPVRAAIRGGYTNSDADHLTRISIDNVTRCISGALRSAQTSPDEVECINAHATSTPIGDTSELTALGNVFGDRLRSIPVVANKSQIGHSLGASAMLGCALAVRGMEEGVALPTLNHRPDPSLPAAFIPAAATEVAHRVTLLDAFGFGGTNVSLVLEGRPS